VSLAQSPSLNLISEEKVSEALHSQGRPRDAPVTRDLVRTICEHVGATVYVTGSIAKDEGKYPLRLNAFRCATNDSLASAKSEADGKGQVVRALGTAATELRCKFGEDPPSLQKFDLPLERATTSSIDARKSFCEGRRLAREKGAIEPGRCCAAGFLPGSGQMQRMRFHLWAFAVIVLFTAFLRGLLRGALTLHSCSNDVPAG
jgi:hypothetical protein